MLLKMSDLIIGGTSGLGLELARKLVAGGSKVIITGRKNPNVDFTEFKKFNLTADNLSQRIQDLVSGLPEIERLVYAAGFYQEGTVTDLDEEQIETMIDVGGRGLIYFVRSLLEKQGGLKELVTITSTSQWTPRKLEPVYNFAKAGAGHFTNAMAEDGRIEKVMVAGPAGMKTEFWEGVERDDLDTMLDPEWVAQQIMDARQKDYRYKYIRILRQPARVEEVEER
jgi:short-subunit dehydrogenase